MGAMSKIVLLSLDIVVKISIRVELLSFIISSSITLSFEQFNIRMDKTIKTKKHFNRAIFFIMFAFK